MSWPIFFIQVIRPHQNPRSAIIGQLKSREAHLSQLGNLLQGCVRVLPVLAGYSAFFAVVGIGTDIMTMEASDFSFEAMKFMLWAYAIFGAVGRVAHCFLFNTGRFYNVYYHRTYAEEDARRSARDERQRQIDLVEDVLVKHGLITDVQREQKRYQNK